MSKRPDRSQKKLDKILDLLLHSPKSDTVFNPWVQVDPENDLGPESPVVRKRQLRHYLRVRLGIARYLMIGEAVGYRGGHFSGIPMTSERILLGYLSRKGIRAEHVLPGLSPRRTSRPDLMPLGFSEPTATIVWGTLLGAGVNPLDFVLWNTFAWHPFHASRGFLSNRKPRRGEVGPGVRILEAFIDLFSECTLIAVGRVAEEALDRLDLAFHAVRHPAQGGSKRFRDQIQAIVAG